MGDAGQVPAGVDVTRPTPARLYDYYLGGTSNFEVDRVAAERLRLRMPELSDTAWANRGFHQRAARWIAGRGVRQFIDIGAGLPTAGNTHQALLGVTPDARVVYADIDPMVTAQAGRLLTGQASTRLVTADLRGPGSCSAIPACGR